MKTIKAIILTFLLCALLIAFTALGKLLYPQTRPEDVFIVCAFFYVAWKELKEPIKNRYDNCSYCNTENKIGTAYCKKCNLPFYGINGKN